MSQEVVLFGNGELAEVIHFYLNHDSDYKVVAFTADEKFIKENSFNGLPVVPFESLYISHPPDKFKMFVALSYRKVNSIRAEKYIEAKNKGYQFISYVNSKASYWPGLDIGENTFIFENNVIQPFVKIGNNTILWSGNHIGHHSTIGDHCFLASHIVVSGMVKVGNKTFIGVNSTLRDNINIGESCVIGAGALILKDLEDFSVVPGKGSEVINKKSFEINF
jgi:sugar O-acyltransferase (sialic acid O-acetyltransferase NeuD family)